MDRTQEQEYPTNEPPSKAYVYFFRLKEKGKEKYNTVHHLEPTHPQWLHITRPDLVHKLSIVALGRFWPAYPWSQKVLLLREAN